MNAFKQIFFFLLLIATPAYADIIDDEEGAKVAPTAPTTAPSPAIEAKKPGKTNRDAVQDPVVNSATRVAPPPAKTGSLAPKGGKKKLAGQKSDAELPIEFESVGLRAQREKGYAEFEKNVVVTQGSMRLEADRAQAYYDDNTKELVKVVCQGNVKLFKTDEDSGEKIKAFGDTAIFLNKERRATMEGNARLWRGPQLVRSKKIVYEMATGWITFDTVAGELQPESKEKVP